MRIVEILDALNSTRLFEMAYERKQAKDLVTSLSPQIFDHLLKLFVLESPNTTQHWIREINAWLFKINKIYLKPNKLKPQKNDLYNWLVFDSAPYYSEQYIDTEIKIMKRNDYKNIPIRDYDSSDVLNKILSIINQVSIAISNNTFESIEDFI
jgi:hypothetical protein